MKTIVLLRDEFFNSPESVVVCGLFIRPDLSEESNEFRLRISSYLHNKIPAVISLISNLPLKESIFALIKCISIQEGRLKRLITLGGLEIGIQHQIVNALELSTPQPPPPPPPPPPPKKKKNKKLFILVIGLIEKIGCTVTV